jgi:hypothetical protein
LPASRIKRLTVSFAASIKEKISLTRKSIVKIIKGRYHEVAVRVMRTVT